MKVRYKDILGEERTTHTLVELTILDDEGNEIIQLDPKVLDNDRFRRLVAHRPDFMQPQMLWLAKYLMDK